MKTIFTSAILFAIFFLMLSDAYGQCGTCAYLTDDLIVNGDFEDGDTGFYSEYDGDPDPGGGLPALWDPATYQIGTDAGDFHWDFEGLAYSPFPWIGSFMIVNGSDVDGMNVWCQDVPVVPGGEYDFSMWVQSLVTQNPASLQVEINGQDVGSVFEAPTNLNNWQEHTFSWIAPDGVFIATICITNVNVIVGGNDFGLDAITFIGCEPYLIDNPAQAGPDTTICSEETLQLGVAPVANISYNWHSNPYFTNLTISNPSITIENNSTEPIQEVFIVESDSMGMGCITQDTVVVTVLPLPNITLAEEIDACSFPLTLDAGIAGAEYTWSNGTTTQQTDVNAPGIYSVEVTVNGCSSTASTEVSAVDFEAVNLGNDQVVCTLPLTLDAGIENATYEWNTGETTQTIIANTAGAYSVTVTHNGCPSTDEVEISVDNYLSFDLGDDFSTCAFPVTLNAPMNDGTYTWSNGENGQSITVDAPGWTWLEIDQDGCAGIDSIFIEQTVFETVNLGPDQTVCTLPITISSDIIGSNYAWSSGQSTASIEVATAGTYSVTVTQNGCTSSDEVEIILDDEIPLDLGNDLAVCTFPVTLESPVGGVNYAWSNGETGSTATFNGPGTVTLDIELDGCTGSDSIELSLFEPDNPNIPDSIESCIAPVILTTDLQNATWTWSTGDQSASTEVQQTGWVYLNFNQSNCDFVDSTYVIIDNTFEFNMPTELAVCSFPVSFVPDVTAEDYLWSHGENTAATEFTSAGTYTLTATADGCVGNRTITVSQIPHETAQLPDTTAVCELPVNLSSGAPNADNYNWNTGSASSNISAGAEGYFRVEVLHNTCNSVDSTWVALIPQPTVSVYPSYHEICEGQNVVIRPAVQFADLVAWSHGPSTINTSIDTEGLYSIYVENECGSDFAEVEVLVSDCDYQLFIPNAFSPNEDGINDLFNVVAHNFKKGSLSVFSRQGDLVFHTDNALNEKWNGAVDGSDYYISSSVFVYLFEGTTILNEVVQRRGTITIVR